MIDFEKYFKTRDGINSTVGAYLGDVLDALQRISIELSENTRAIQLQTEALRLTNQRLAWIDESIAGQIRQPKIEGK